MKATFNAPASPIYLADIRHAQCLSRPVSVGNYSPFGVTLHNRDLSLTSGSGNVPYRYGFNGMEKDDELKGEGNSYTTEFRQYDPRLGRWLSIDPLYRKFPWQSPYVSFDNKPILMNDPKGLAAQGGGDKGYTKNADGSRSKGNADGSKTYDAPGFTQVILPKGAIVLGTMQDSNGNGKIDNGKGTELSASKGDLYKFKIDGVIYTGRFSNTGKFLGYYSEKNKKYIAKIPEPLETGNATFDKNLKKTRDHYKNNKGEYVFEHKDGDYSSTDAAFSGVNYNCYEFALSLTQGSEPNYTLDLGCGDADGNLDNIYTSVSRIQMIPGKSIIRFGGTDDNGDVTPTHYAVFMMNTASGIIVATKNGNQKQPRIMYLHDLILQHPEYGTMTPLNGDNTPYYNFNW